MTFNSFAPLTFWVGVPTKPNHIIAATKSMLDRRLLKSEGGFLAIVEFKSATLARQSGRPTITSLPRDGRYHGNALLVSTLLLVLILPRASAGSRGNHTTTTSISSILTHPTRPFEGEKACFFSLPRKRSQLPTQRKICASSVKYCFHVTCDISLTWRGRMKLNTLFKIFALADFHPWRAT